MKTALKLALLAGGGWLAWEWYKGTQQPAAAPAASGGTNYAPTAAVTAAPVVVVAPKVSQPPVIVRPVNPRTFHMAGFGSYAVGPRPWGLL